MRLSGPAVACRGFALAEVLVALLLFSLAIAGGLRAQLGALTGTRDTLWQARAGRLLQDLAQRDGAGQLLALAPATLPLAGPPAALNLPPAIGEWVAVALAPQARPPGAALCLTPRDAHLELAITWPASGNAADADCAQDGRRVKAYVVAP